MAWHGQYVRQGNVVYLVAEGARGIRKRVRAWEQHYGVRMDNVLFLPRPVQTRGPEWDTLIEAMRRLAPQMIVIDTQARVSVGVEENSNTELGVVIERIEDLRRATGACVLVIHHTGHVGEHGRGSSSAKGALQSEMHVSKKGDSAKNIVVTMKVGKQKDDEQGGDLQFGLKVVTIHGEAKPDGQPAKEDNPQRFAENQSACNGQSNGMAEIGEVSAHAGIRQGENRHDDKAHPGMQGCLDAFEGRNTLAGGFGQFGEGGPAVFARS